MIPTTLVVPEAKLTRYLLDPDHPVGGPKAKFFNARGFSRANATGFAQALIRHVGSADTERLITEVKADEARLVAVGPLACPDGSVPIVKSVWKIDVRSESASLVTAYPARKAAAPAQPRTIASRSA